MKHKSLILFVCLWSGAVCPIAHAELTVASLFGDHMVLQQGAPVIVWGTAAANDEVKVHFGAQQQETQADVHGRWRGTLDPMPVALEGSDLAISSAGAQAVFHDVLVGEVWLC